MNNLKKIICRFGVFGRMRRLFDEMEKCSTAIEGDVELQASMIQEVKELLCVWPRMVGPKLGAKIVSLYRGDFEYPDCEVCKSTSWKLSYVGKKVLPAKLYAGGRFFPYYAREVLPLIYFTCKKCGIGRVRPSPSVDRIDETLSGISGDGIWMEEIEYQREKKNYFLKHYEKCNLQKFKSGSGFVFEVSCGAGTVLKAMAEELGWSQCLGIEPDLVAYEASRNITTISVKRGLIGKIDLPLNLDLVILDNSLEHHSSSDKVLKTVFRSLRHGGGVFIIVPNFHALTVEKFGVEHFNLNWGHWHYYTAQSLFRHLVQVGFEVQQAYTDTLDKSVVELSGTVGVEKNFDLKILSKISPKKRVGCGEFLYFVAKKL